MKELEKRRQNVRDKIASKNEKLAIKSEAPKHKELKPNQLKKGDSVKILSMGLTGTVSTLPDSKGNLFVQCGIIRSQTNIKDLILVQDPKPAAPVLQRTGAGKIKIQICQCFHGNQSAGHDGGRSYTYVRQISG